MAVDAVVWSLPMRVRFRGLTRREGVLVRGDAGWGEWSPFPEYGVAEARRWWAAAREAADVGWPAPVRTSVPVNASVPAVAAVDVPAVLARFPGCTTVKVKVAEPGRDPADTVEDDLARLAAVRAALGPAGRVRIDLNAAWDLDTARRLLPRYDRAAGGLEYAEQPCADVADLAALRRRVDVPIAADESLRRSADPLAVARLGAADVAVLKVQPLGGVRAALRLAEDLGLPAVVSSALESSVGIAAGVALAAALPELPYACGLGTAALLGADLVADPLLPVAGAIEVRRPEPDDALLAAAAASPEVVRWWRDRQAAATA